MATHAEIVVKEMESELRERMEDNKKKRWLAQASTTTRSLFMIVEWYLRCFVLFFPIQLLIMTFIAAYDASFITAITHSTIEELQSAAKTILALNSMLSFFGVFILGFSGKLRFRDLRNEEEAKIEDDIKLANDIATMTEELLYRHGLISMNKKDARL
jgi:hypothetical protein